VSFAVAVNKRDLVPYTYKVLVKVVDIFGNDTTKLLEVKVT